VICQLHNISLYFDAHVLGDDVPVLYLHSALTSSAEMQSIRSLFHERSSVALDLPGHGRSRETCTLTTSVIAEALDEFLNKLRISKVDIVGYSLGGYIALALAKRSPQKVRSVVTHAMKFYWTPEAIDNAVATFAKAPVEQRSIDAMASIILAFNREQLTADDIRSSDIPVLITTGERDEFVTAAEVGRLWNEVGNAKTSFAIIPNAGHSLRKLPLAEFEQVVREFWGTIG
jgi:pimeloyl-ACP methyl ester carboxylesterase